MRIEIEITDFHKPNSPYDGWIAFHHGDKAPWNTVNVFCRHDDEHDMDYWFLMNDDNSQPRNSRKTQKGYGTAEEAYRAALSLVVSRIPARELDGLDRPTHD